MALVEAISPKILLLKKIMNNLQPKKDNAFFEAIIWTSKAIIAFILLFCLSLGSISAQESAKLYNAGDDALKAKDYAKALENYEKKC